MNSLFLQALKCTNQSRPPIWMMRQAGRYMPEYRAIRSKYSFLEMCHEPDLMAKVTKLPIDVFGFDAAIMFSDILVIPEAMQVGLRFDEGIGPIIERPIHSSHDIDSLPCVNVEEALGFVAKGIKLLKNDLKVPLVGFCGAPFTVASYMIEGKSSKDLKKTKQMMFRDPENFHKLLMKITDASISYLKMQIKAGVDALQIFDSWAHVLAYGQFQEFSLSYLERMIDALKETKVPIILFCKGSSVFADQLAELHPAAISLDWNCDIGQMRKKIPSHIALQGNLDPDVLYGSKKVIEHEAEKILTAMQGQPGYIFNLGHGIHPDIPVEAVKTLVNCVQNRKSS